MFVLNQRSIYNPNLLLIKENSHCLVITNKLTSLMFASKRIVLAITLSLLLGTLLGLLMLLMFTSMNENNNGVPPITSDESEENSSTTSNDYFKVTEISSLSAHVLQAGIFSELENAQHWLKTFQAYNYQPIIWSKDSYYYLFVGIANSKEENEFYKKEFSKDGLEVYIKEWETEANKVAMKDEEEKWINTFQKLWQQSVKAQTLDSDWEGLLTEGKNINSFEEMSIKAEEIYNNHDGPEDIQYFLLTTWNEYEKMLKKFIDRK